MRNNPRKIRARSPIYILPVNTGKQQQQLVLCECAGSFPIYYRCITVKSKEPVVRCCCCCFALLSRVVCFVRCSLAAFVASRGVHCPLAVCRRAAVPRVRGVGSEQDREQEREQDRGARYTTGSDEGTRRVACRRGFFYFLRSWRRLIATPVIAGHCRSFLRGSSGR